MWKRNMERLTEVRKDREKVPREQDETTHQLIRERERERHNMGNRAGAHEILIRDNAQCSPNSCNQTIVYSSNSCNQTIVYPSNSCNQTAPKTGIRKRRKMFLKIDGARTMLPRQHPTPPSRAAGYGRAQVHQEITIRAMVNALLL